MTASSTNLRGEGRHGGSRPQLTGDAVQCLPPLCARPGSDRQPECFIIEFGRGRPQARFSFLFFPITRNQRTFARYNVQESTQERDRNGPLWQARWGLNSCPVKRSRETLHY